MGVLDIRGTGRGPLPRHAAMIGALMAQQLSLYEELLFQLSELRKQPRKLAQSYEDFKHQLMSPLIQTEARAERSLRRAQAHSDSELLKDLRAVRGLAAKSLRVGNSLGLFAVLAQGNPIPLIRERLDSSIVRRR